MFSALFSFIGGSAFRMIWGEAAAWLTKAQDHTQELERMKMQADLDAAQHARSMEAIRVQAELQVKVVQVQGEANVSTIEAEGWKQAVIDVGKSVGIVWVDGWNAVIRPAVATWAVIMLTLGEFQVVVLTEAVMSVAMAALGIYLADRNLAKRGK